MHSALTSHSDPVAPASRQYDAINVEFHPQIPDAQSEENSQRVPFGNGRVAQTKTPPLVTVSVHAWVPHSSEPSVQVFPMALGGWQVLVVASQNRLVHSRDSVHVAPSAASTVQTRVVAPGLGQ